MNKDQAKKMLLRARAQESPWNLCPLCESMHPNENTLAHHIMTEHLTGNQCWCGRYLLFSFGADKNKGAASFFWKHMNMHGGILAHFTESALDAMR